GVRLVLDARAIEVGLGRDRADGRELVAVELDARDAWIREGLEPCVMLRAGMPERHEFGRARRRLHGRRVPGRRRGYAAPSPLRWRPRAARLVAHSETALATRAGRDVRELFELLEAARADGRASYARAS